MSVLASESKHPKNGKIIQFSVFRSTLIPQERDAIFCLCPRPSLADPYHLHPLHARAICLHNDLLYDSACSATGGAKRTGGGGGGGQTENIRAILFRCI